MPTLVIHAPSQTVKTGKRSFASTFNLGVGTGYAIPSTLLHLVSPKCKVVLLDKNKKKRAEGTLTCLTPTRKASNGQQRYDVYVKGFKNVTYKSERLTRNGIAVF